MGETLSSVKEVTDDEDLPVQPGVVGEYLAWRIANATMPVATRVTSANGRVGTVTFGAFTKLRIADELVVYRASTDESPPGARSLRQPLATRATIVGIRNNTADIKLRNRNVDYLWADDCALQEGDLVIAVDRKLPLVATLGATYYAPSPAMLRELGLSQTQYESAREKAERTLRRISDRVKDKLLASDVQIIAAVGHDLESKRKDAVERGATHLVEFSVSFTREPGSHVLKNSVKMGLWPINDEGDKTLVTTRVNPR
jgi:hypothetical protein